MEAQKIEKKWERKKSATVLGESWGGNESIESKISLINVRRIMCEIFGTCHCFHSDFKKVTMDNHMLCFLGGNRLLWWLVIRRMHLSSS